ncbi:MAG: molybdate ABC transporter substrate-binding protein, partial [Xanthobacteraceae bacterium]
MTAIRMLAAVLAGASVTAEAAELKVLSGNGARAAVRELASQFERASGHKVALRFEVNAELKRKIEAGETFDVAILNPPVIEDLIKQGKIVAGTRADIGRAGLAVAVRARAPK